MIEETPEELRHRLEGRSDYYKLSQPVAFWLAPAGKPIYAEQLVTVGRFPAGTIVLAGETSDMGDVMIILAKPKNGVESRCFASVAARWNVMFKLSPLESLAAQAE